MAVEVHVQGLAACAVVLPAAHGTATACEPVSGRNNTIAPRTSSGLAMIRGVERYNPVLRRQVLGRARGLAVLQHASFSISQHIRLYRQYTFGHHRPAHPQHAQPDQHPVRKPLLQVSFDLRRPVERLICPFPI